MTPTTQAPAKWTAENLGPRQAKLFNEALSKFAWEAKTVGEITDHGTFYTTPMFGGSWTETATRLMDEIRAKYNLIVTGDNYKAIIADLGAAIPALHANRRMVDKRSTPEERAEREQATREREEKAKAEAARISQFEHHEYNRAQTAAEIKRVLMTLWPGTKWSVTSENYSGGGAIRASWIDGPTEKQVRGVMDVFQDTHFDGMDDSTHHSGPEEWNGHRFRFHSGYCSQSRGNSAALLDLCCQRFTKETGLTSPAVIADRSHPYLEREGGPCGYSFHHHGYDNDPDGVLSHDDHANWTKCDIVNQMVHATATETAAHQLAEDGNQDAYEKTKDAVFRIILGEIKTEVTAVALISDSTGGETPTGVSVTQNEERDGVEIRFADKPDSAILDRLKSAGWRWSRFSKCWYAKRSPASLAFAASLAGKEGDRAGL